MRERAERPRGFHRGDKRNRRKLGPPRRIFHGLFNGDNGASKAILGKYGTTTKYASRGGRERVKVFVRIVGIYLNIHRQNARRVFFFFIKDRLEQRGPEIEFIPAERRCPTIDSPLVFPLGNLLRYAVAPLNENWYSVCSSRGGRSPRARISQTARVECVSEAVNAFLLTTVERFPVVSTENSLR